MPPADPGLPPQPSSVLPTITSAPSVLSPAAPPPTLQDESSPTATSYDNASWNVPVVLTALTAGTLALSQLALVSILLRSRNGGVLLKSAPSPRRSRRRKAEDEPSENRPGRRRRLPRFRHARKIV